MFLAAERQAFRSGCISLVLLVHSWLLLRLFSQCTRSPRCISEKFRFSTTRIAGFISLARSHISCSVFFLTGLRDFAYSHEGVRQLSRGCMGGDLASSDPGNGLGTSRWSRQTVKERQASRPFAVAVCRCDG